MKNTASKKSRQFDVSTVSKAVCEKLLSDLETARRPVLKATKCALDNCLYDAKLGYLTA